MYFDEDKSESKVFSIRWLKKDVVLKNVLSFNADVVFVCAGGMSLTEETIKELKKMGVITVCITLSDPDVYFDNGRKYCSWYDIYYTNSLYALNQLYKNSDNCKLLPFAASPQLHKPMKVPKKYDVVIVGHARADRIVLVNKLKKKFKIGLFGNGWYKNRNTEVHGLDHVKAINSGKLYLSFANTSAGYTNVKVGLFEAAACGVPVITNYFKEVESYYTFGIDILGYTNELMLISLIKLYLKNNVLRQLMAKNIYKKTLSRHTWWHRWNIIINDIEIVRVNKKNKYIILSESYLESSIKNGLACNWDVINNIWLKSYPEVTAYLISYFCKRNFLPIVILSAAEKLIKLQSNTGGFPSFDNRELLYTFDTGQIMKGFADLYIKTKNIKYLEVAIKAANFLLNMQRRNGSYFPIYNSISDTKIVFSTESDGKNWGSIFSYIQLKNAEGLLEIYNITGDEKYKKSIDKLLSWGIKEENIDCKYTHPFAYYLEGLFACGKKRMVKTLLKQYVIPKIQNNGYIEYFSGAGFSYVSGSAQLAILLYKSGYKKYALMIRNWLRIVSLNSGCGGLFQYANSDGTLCSKIHSEINTWGTKYFCELEYLFL
ncbi:MAG: glycosyltransferase [Candidatus Margulisiibacteriota bacterium]